MHVSKIYSFESSNFKKNNVGCSNYTAKPNYIKAHDTFTFGINPKKVPHVLPEAQKIFNEAQKLIGEVLELIEIEGEKQITKFEGKYTAIAEKLPDNSLKIAFETEAGIEDNIIMIAKDGRFNTKLISKGEKPLVRYHDATDSLSFNRLLVKTLRKYFLDVNKIFPETQETIDEIIKLIDEKGTGNKLIKIFKNEYVSGNENLMATAEKLPDGNFKFTLQSADFKNRQPEIDNFIVTFKFKSQDSSEPETKVATAKRLADDTFSFKFPTLRNEKPSTPESLSINFNIPTRDSKGEIVSKTKKAIAEKLPNGSYKFTLPGLKNQPDSEKLVITTENGKYAMAMHWPNGEIENFKFKIEDNDFHNGTIRISLWESFLYVPKPRINKAKKG